MRALSVWVSGVSVLGPGLPGWTAAEPILAGAAPWVQADFVPPPPSLLPPTERRRTSLAVRLALAAAYDAVQASGLPPEELAPVFASSNGDGAVIGAILDALQPREVAISPTQFHNSVHNAAAGYWAIAVGSNRSSVSLGGHDRVFATGLMQAAAQVVAARVPVLYCAYDAPLPPPLAAKRRTDVAFAAALVLMPAQGAAARARLDLAFAAEAASGDPEVAGMLGALQAMNPAARALPLLMALAARREARFLFPLDVESRLELGVVPC